MPTGTGESRTDLEQIRELEERLDNLRIQVADDMTIRGSAWQGYALNTFTCDEIGQGGTPPPPGTGACCLPDDTCEVVTPGQCLLDGGTFIGGSCEPNPCVDETGACCTDGVCSILSESDCTDGGGNYLGDGTTCEGVDCGHGACCDADGHCNVFTEAACLARPGTYYGDGTTCTPSPCPTGSCCTYDSTAHCDVLHFFECNDAAGTYGGDGTTCSPFPCIGICCDCGEPCEGCCFSLESDCEGSWSTNQDCGNCHTSCCLPDTPFPCCVDVTQNECIDMGGTGASFCLNCEVDTCSCSEPGIFDDPFFG